jgi:chaperonin cofactor prefoldin
MDYEEEINMLQTRILKLERELEEAKQARHELDKALSEIYSIARNAL